MTAPPTGSDLDRFGQASAELDDHPELHLELADSSDRAVRRAVMRSPRLDPEAAELVVASRRSGMHTLGSNPVAPVELLRDNPSALRRRAAIDELAPAGLADIVRDPDRPGLIELGSGTVDLVLARAPGLTVERAVELAGRRDPPADPWTLALLIERFGEPVRAAVAAHSAPRRAATARLADRARRADQVRRR